MKIPAPTIKFIVVTPDRTTLWNNAVVEGEKQPYVLFGLDENYYLTMAQWLQNILFYIESQKAVIEAYENDVNTYNRRYGFYASTSTGDGN
jgi:hypothetical protein